MNDFLTRIVKENKALQSKLSKLCKFMKTSEYLELSPANRILLERQCELMKQYRDVLDVRIELNSKNK